VILHEPQPSKLAVGSVDILCDIGLSC